MPVRVIGDAGTYTLGIDFGTSNTVAVLGWPDGRVRPLLFDGAPLLPSAVCLDASGALLVGRDAVNASMSFPERFEPHPKRRIDEGVLLLGDAEVPVQAAIEAVLRRVAAEARRVAGQPIGRIALTCPVSWAARRQAVLVAAAERAGLGGAHLVVEPLAAAHHFADLLGERIPPGGHLLVHDFGAGTFDATIVRRTGDGFAVVVSAGLSDAGGLDVDAAVVAHFGAVYGEQNRTAWHRLERPASPADRRHSRQLWDRVREAKESLSRTAAALIHLPLLELDAPLGRDQLDQLARPVVDRSVAAARGALLDASIEPRDLTAIVLVGGASRMPLVATGLHRAFGIAPVALEQPELVVAEGSLRAVPPPPAPRSTAPTTPAPVSTLPTSATPMPAFPTSAAPMPAFPTSAAPISTFPTTAPPISTFPTSAPPISAFPTSAPPISTFPTSAPPTSASPAAAATSPPANTPATGGPPSNTLAASGRPNGGRPGDAPAVPARWWRRRPVWIAAAAAVVVAGLVAAFVVLDAWSPPAGAEGGPAGQGGRGLAGAAPNGSGGAVGPNASSGGSPGAAGAPGPVQSAGAAGSASTGATRPGATSTTKAPTKAPSVFPRTRTTEAGLVTEQVGVPMTLVSGSGPWPDFRFSTSIKGRNGWPANAAADMRKHNIMDYQREDRVISWSMAVHKCTGEKVDGKSATDQATVSGLLMDIDRYSGSFYVTATIKSFQATLDGVVWKGGPVTVTSACITL